MMKRVLAAVLSSKFRSLVIVLAVIIVFVTTYSLILPAVTMESGAIKEEDGIALNVEENDLEVGETLNQDQAVSDPASQTETGYAPYSASEVAASEAAFSVQNSENSNNETNVTDQQSGYPAMIFETEIEREGDVVTTEALSVDEESNASDESSAYEYDAEGNLIEKQVILKVRVEAEEGAFPEGTTMKVEEVSTDDNVVSTVKDVAQTETGKKVKEIQAVDITFFDACGNEIEPAKQIKVTFSSDTIKDRQQTTGLDQSIIHIQKDGNTEVIDEIDESKLETAPEEDQVIFEAETFSVYAVVYTVDFSYSVDGKEYTFSIPGGSGIAIRDLVSAVGIAEDKPETDIDELQEFMESIVDVSFTSPELVWLGTVVHDNTIADIKEFYALECEYSAELTEEDIAEINAREVRAGDWALISLKPFTSEEALTISMENGDQFVIKVTDAQDPSVFIGKEVIIHYDGRAMTSNWDNVYRPELQSVAEGDADAIESAHWILEYNQNDPGYYLKAKNGQYIKLDYDNISLVSNTNQATLFTIQPGSNPDYMIYDKYNTNNVLTYCFNNQYDGYFCAPRGAYTTPQQWLYIRERASVEQPPDWLLYLDEDLEEITIHVGESITLRPYDEWTWKEGNIQNYHWNVELPSGQNWNIYGNEADGANFRTWTDSTGIFDFTRFVKYDDQLLTRYWSLQGVAKKTGDYILTNTKNNHSITVHVVDGSPVSRPGIIQNTANIKVNLFDYDRYGVLDPSDNSNQMNSPVKNDTINNGHSLKFLSSGGGDMTAGHLNAYTKDNPNTGLVNNTLTNGFPKLKNNYGGDSLEYLFDTTKTSWTGSNQDVMIAYPNVEGLFQRDELGYYYYNSNVNYAYYNPENGNKKITLYEHTYTQRSSADKDSRVNTKPIGFFPFHDYESTANLWVNQNKELNHHIGMSMDVDFFIPANRKDENGRDIEFSFSGDDDLWVFVEWIDNEGNKQSKLLLDLGGVHQPIIGTINFTDSSTGLEANKSYKLKVFYLERGGCDSNCSIRFNLPIVKDLTVAKKLNGLTPTERQKYFEDSFLYELALKESSQGMDINLSDDDAVWQNQSWREGFQLYNTPVNTTNENRNNTVYHSNSGDIKGYPVSNGHISLKNGESFTVSNLPRTDIFYLAEENQLDMEQFETPHAERLYIDSVNQEHEEEVALHMDTAVSDGMSDWETKPYALMDTERLVYTNTLQEKNLDVKKTWSDGNTNHSGEPVQFKIKAQVKDAQNYLTNYDSFIQNYNNTHNTSCSTDINAQWTETVGGDTTTKTEDILNKVFTLNSGNDWRILFEHLPKKTQEPNGSGFEIVYSIEEVKSTIPDGYNSTVKAAVDANKVYVDIYKFWPDANSNHYGSNKEDFHVRIKNKTTNEYITAVRDENGEWRYTGTTTDQNTATQVLITSKDNLSGLHTADQAEMLDYAARVNNLPRTDGVSTEYEYIFEQVGDDDPNTTGLVMFTRPAEEIEILNTPEPKNITIKKVDANNVESLLPNAVFQLYRINDQGADEKFENDAFALEGEGEDAKHTGSFTITSGTITLNNLAPGLYHLKEISPPAGYIIINADTYFELKRDGTIDITDASGTHIDPTNDTAVILRDSNTSMSVKNTPGAALPQTGGEGTKLIMALGITLIGLAGAWLLMRRRKKAA